MEDFHFEIDEKYRKPEAVEVAVKLLEHYLNSDEKIITYGDLCKKMSYPVTARNIEKWLGYVSFACKDNNLPPISAIVVNKTTSIPGFGFFKEYFPGVKPKNYDEKYIEVLKQILAYKYWDRVLEAYKTMM